jgi:RHS repeat-associated protein
MAGVPLSIETVQHYKGKYERGETSTFEHTFNARGDVISISDDSKNRVRKYSYDPWGKIIEEKTRSSQYNNLSCPYAYAGYLYDAETGLYYMLARHYPPFLRRFLTKDSLPGRKSNSLTLNPYQYCENNPINRVDPTGQDSLEAAVAVMIAGIDTSLSAMSSALGARLHVRMPAEQEEVMPAFKQILRCSRAAICRGWR